MHERTSDPYRNKAMTVPQLEGDETPIDGPVNVLSLVDRYPPWINAGAEWMLHSIFRKLVEHGHTVRVFTQIPDHYQHDVPEIVDGVEVYPAKFVDGLMANWADVIVGHLLWTRDVVALAVRYSKPLIYLLHNERQIAHWNLTGNNVTVLVPNSEWIRKTTSHWPGPQIVCRPPVFCDDYAVKTDDARKFVTLVNLIPEKGVETFYEVARMRHRDQFLGVVGAYGHQHRPPPHVGNVTVIPPTPNMRDDVYAKTRILLMPSWYESWGRVAVEAMAAGVPVIAGQTPGLREALGEAAIYLDPHDHPSWIETVGRLTDDRKLWKAQQRKGRARAKQLEQDIASDLDDFEDAVRRCAALNRSG